MAFENCGVESQRDSGSKPKVARNELPWGTGRKTNNPNGVAAERLKPDATPLGLKTIGPGTQGSSFLATLGGRHNPFGIAEPSVFRVLRPNVPSTEISERPQGWYHCSCWRWACRSRLIARVRRPRPSRQLSPTRYLRLLSERTCSSFWMDRRCMENCAPSMSREAFSGSIPERNN